MPTATRFYDYPARFYLDRYYSTVGNENAAFMRAVGDAVAPLETLKTVVELGGGPSLCGALAMTAATAAGPSRVIWIDAGLPNLCEVDSWLRGAETAFDYTPVLDWLEQEFSVSREAVAERLRCAEWDIRHVDLWHGVPVDIRGAGDVVASYFVAECATDSEAEFVALTTRVLDAARIGGNVVLAYVRDSEPYQLQDDAVLPALSLDEDSLPALLDAAGLRFEHLEIRRGPLDEPAPRRGYSGMAFVYGRLAA